MNIQAFFIDALSSALELNIAKPEDVLHHVTPDVLSRHLPRPLWARLITACLAASRVDAQLVVETIGIPNLCEHIPASILWGCIADVAGRSLGKAQPAVARWTFTAAQRERLADAAATADTALRALIWRLRWNLRFDEGIVRGQRDVDQILMHGPQAGE